MKDSEIEGNIQINDNSVQKESVLIEESPNKIRNSDLIIQINDATKKEETPKKQEASETNNNRNSNNNNDQSNYPISENNQKGLFSQFEAPKKQETYEQRMTLDEPVLSSLKRDLSLIYHKLKHVITPRLSSQKIEELYNWDLWGPLIFCFLLSISLSNENNESSTFVTIFSIFWIGGLIVTFNGQFLGANIGICQMICLLGYCSFPITLAGIIIGFFDINQNWIKCILSFFAFLWSCLASVGFISSLVGRDKELITIIPVVLFFATLALFVLNY